MLSPVEIVFVVLGVIILIVSCFVTGGSGNGTDSGVSEDFIESQKASVENYISRLLEERSEEVIVRTDDYLSRIANEKIMAVNDFSSQILEKIDANHKEVVFLYDMLNQKEDEIKKTVRQFDGERLQIKETMEEIIRMKTQLAASSVKTETESIPVDQTGRAVIRPEEDILQVSENRADGQQEASETDQSDAQREEVLKLHKEGNSIQEISKALGIGQGEVRLIIGIYGAK